MRTRPFHQYLAQHNMKTQELDDLWQISPETRLSVDRAASTEFPIPPGVEPVLIRKVKEPWGFFGNMWSCPIVYGDAVWLSSEALFQALRFPSCPEAQREIGDAKSPMTSKMKAKRIAAQRRWEVEPCSTQDVRNMLQILRLKAEQHPVLIDKLRETGDRPIIEDCTARRSGGRHLFWGAALRGDRWMGYNVLGRLWMMLRAERRAR